MILVLLLLLTKNVFCCIDVVVGSQHICSLHDSGDVFCSGDNNEGQLGNDMEGGAPTRVDGINNAIKISSDYYTNYALLDNGTVVGWGYNGFHQIRHDDDILKISYPWEMTTVSPFVTIVNGLESACSLDNNGVVRCWGYDHHPTTMISNVISLHGYNDGYCVINIDNKVACWGKNSGGRFGNIGSYIMVPTTISPWGHVKKMTVGKSHCCVITTHDEIMCSGYPIAIDTYVGGTPMDIMARNNNLCIHDNNYFLWCIGYDPFNMFGGSDTMFKQVGVVPLKKVSFDTYNMVIQDMAGNWFVGGDNYYGQFGNNNFNDTPYYEAIHGGICG